MSARLLVPPKPKEDTPEHISRREVVVSSWELRAVAPSHWREFSWGGLGGLGSWGLGGGWGNLEPASQKQKPEPKKKKATRGGGKVNLLFAAPIMERSAVLFREASVEHPRNWWKNHKAPPLPLSRAREVLFKGEGS